MSRHWKLLTPIYNTSILVTKKPVSGIIFFGHFLVRLSGNERSLVVSMGSFCWARSNYGYEILTQKLSIFEVRIEHSCDLTFTARLNWTWPSSSPWNSDDFPFFWFLHCTSRIRARPFWKLVNICQNLINQLCRPGQPAKSWWMMVVIILAAGWRLNWARQRITQILTIFKMV